MNGVSKPVAIIMGSQSDWAVMRRSAETLATLGVAYEARIVSAHRTPDRLVAFAKGAKGEGFKVVIRGPGARPVAGHDGSVHDAAGIRRAGPLEGAVGPGQPVLDRPDASRRAGRDARDRRSGRGQCHALACAVLPLSDDALAARLEAWRAARTAEVAERPANEGAGQ